MTFTIFTIVEKKIDCELNKIIQEALEKRIKRLGIIPEKEIEKNITISESISHTKAVPPRGERRQEFWENFRTLFLNNLPEIIGK